MKKLIILLAALLVPLLAHTSFAAQLRVFVTDMNVIGVQNRDEMKLSLQTLLASRLSGEKLIAVGSAAEADVLVSGTYIMIGKVFSMDAMARTSNGRTLARTFIQGDSSEELISSVGKLADKLSLELVKLIDSGQITATPLQLAAPPVRPAASDIIRNEHQQQLQYAPTSNIIRPREIEQGNVGGWVSKRLPGAANLLAVGKTLADGSREIFLAEDQRLIYFRQGSELKQMADVQFKNTEKILSLDTIEGSNGTLEIYVTIIRGDDLVSQVWQVKGDKIAQLATDLPYYFRVINLAGGPKKLYAQEIGRDTDYYGDVCEATRNGNSISLKNPIKMPRFGSIYNFNQFRDNEGKLWAVVINPDNYLVVYDQEQNEIWRSNDRFGGSELHFERPDTTVNARVTGQNSRWIFLDQRIQVTSKEEILVGKNEGTFVVGNSRSYKKGAVYCLAWNGSSLEEKWRTRDTQNYMPDFWLDEAKNELLILQKVQRPGLSERGASSLSIKKVE
jgi:hypothetical protein